MVLISGIGYLMCGDGWVGTVAADCLLCWSLLLLLQSYVSRRPCRLRSHLLRRTEASLRRTEDTEQRVQHLHHHLRHVAPNRRYLTTSAPASAFASFAPTSSRRSRCCLLAFFACRSCLLTLFTLSAFSLSFSSCCFAFSSAAPFFGGLLALGQCRWDPKS